MHYSTIDTLVIGEDNPREKNLFIILSNENFSIRLNNFFKNNNLYFVGDVVTLTKGEILRSPKTGQETVKELEAFLEKYNLRLSMDLIGWPPPNFDEHYKKYQDQKDTFINYENPKIDTLTIGENNPREKNLFIKLSDKEFSVRTNNFFNNNKLYYVGDLVTLTRRSILNSNNTGVKTVQEIQIFLDKHDLRLSMDLVGWPPPNFDAS